MACCDRRRPLYKFRRRQTPQPIHWVVLFFVAISITAWVLMDVAGSIKYSKSVLSSSGASRRTSIDDDYKLKIEGMLPSMHRFCKMFSATSIFGHNLELDGTVFDDHIFHDCRSRKTWLNARVSKAMGDEMVTCTEEFAGVFKKRKKHKVVYVHGVDPTTWEEVEVRVSDLESCVAQHSIDVLDSSW